jgi:MarR family transcriptional regulator, transcriptional regulator for hemolysin
MQKPNLLESFGFLVTDVARLMRRDFNRKVQDLGLTQAQWQILVRISHMEGARQSQIADVLEMQPISVARMIDRMAAAGWVERRPDPQDRRAVNLYLTDKVEPILEQMWARAAETRALAVAGLSEDDQQALLRILRSMRANMTNEEGVNDDR